MEYSVLDHYMRFIPVLIFDLMITSTAVATPLEEKDRLWEILKQDFNKKYKAELGTVKNTKKCFSSGECVIYYFSSLDGKNLATMAEYYNVGSLPLRRLICHYTENNSRRDCVDFDTDRGTVQKKDPEGKWHFVNE